MVKEKDKSRAKILIENIVIYGFGGSISKLIHFIMIPFIIRMLPDASYYGYNDIVTVLVSFGEALAVMGMCDTMYRFFFDREEISYKREICSTSLMVVLVSTMMIGVLGVVFSDQLTIFLFNDSKEFKRLVLLTIIIIVVTALAKIMMTPTKMENKRGTYLAINIISALCLYVVAVLLLKREFYLFALPVASFVSALIQLVVYGFINHRWFSVKNINIRYIKPMLIVTLPLVPNVLLYWIFSSCDRFMIANTLGMNQEGIYAAGAKLGQASQLIYGAFAGGWQYFAFSTMKDEDQVSVISKILEYAGIITYIIGMFVAVISNFLFGLFFTEEYAGGEIVVPYLFISPLLLMLFQIAGSQLLIIKKTWMNLLILISGAMVNVLFNWGLISKVGIEGAAIGTFIGYAFILISIVVLLHKMKLLIVTKRFVCASFVFLLYGFIWRMACGISYEFVITVLIISLLFLGLPYKRELAKVLSYIYRVKNKILLHGETNDK